MSQKSNYTTCVTELPPLVVDVAYHLAKKFSIPGNQIQSIGLFMDYVMDRDIPQHQFPFPIFILDRDPRHMALICGFELYQEYLGGEIHVLVIWANPATGLVQEESLTYRYLLDSGIEVMY